MCIVREDFVRNRVYIFPIIVLYKVKLDQVSAFERLAVDWIRAVLLDPWQNVQQVKDYAAGGTDGMREGLE
jgi:hypothetical protein